MSKAFCLEMLVQLSQTHRVYNETGNYLRYSYGSLQHYYVRNTAVGMLPVLQIWIILTLGQTHLYVEYVPMLRLPGEHISFTQICRSTQVS